jgi:hypothetical protein
MLVKDREFSQVAELMDGNAYQSCKFEKCDLVYRGGAIPTIKDCQFHDCTWRFENAADRTLTFMRLIYHGMGPRGAELVESAFDEVRKPISE